MRPSPRVRRWSPTALLLACCSCATTAPTSPAAEDATPDVAGLPADADPSPIDTSAPAPEITKVWLGVEGLPAAMVGTTAKGAPLRWAVPTQGYTLDVHAEADGPPQQAPTLESTPAAKVTPGAWQPEGKSGWRWSALVETASADAGPVQWTATLGSQSASLGLTVVERKPANDPFEQPDPWLLTFSRDIGSVAVLTLPEGVTVVVTNTPNGKVDFAETLAALGLQGGDAAFNQAVVALVRERIVAWLRDFFHHDGAGGATAEEAVRVQLLVEGDPALASIDAGKLSKMAIGGSAPDKPGKRQLFGLATIDFRNAQANDDSSDGLGVFTFSMVRAAFAQAIVQTLLQPALPLLGGAAFGALPGDSALVAPGFDPATLPEGPLRQRGQLFALEVRLLSLAIAAVTAHEMGHSLGLIAPGPPPKGLLGGVDGPWVVKKQDEHHLDTAGPNLMQTGDSFNAAELLSQTPAFSALELGYLRRRLLVL